MDYQDVEMGKLTRELRFFSSAISRVLKLSKFQDQKASFSCIPSCKNFSPLSVRDFSTYQVVSCPTFWLLPLIGTDLPLFGVYCI